MRLRFAVVFVLPNGERYKVEHSLDGRSPTIPCLTECDPCKNSKYSENKSCGRHLEGRAVSAVDHNDSKNGGEGDHCTKAVYIHSDL